MILTPCTGSYHKSRFISILREGFNSDADCSITRFVVDPVNCLPSLWSSNTTFSCSALYGLSASSPEESSGSKLIPNHTWGEACVTDCRSDARETSLVRNRPLYTKDHLPGLPRTLRYLSCEQRPMLKGSSQQLTILHPALPRWTIREWWSIYPNTGILFCRSNPIFSFMAEAYSVSRSQPQ